jgi:hypothetical protein
MTHRWVDLIELVSRDLDWRSLMTSPDCHYDANAESFSVKCNTKLDTWLRLQGL